MNSETDQYNADATSTIVPAQVVLNSESIQKSLHGTNVSQTSSFQQEPLLLNASGCTPRSWSQNATSPRTNAHKQEKPTTITWKQIATEPINNNNKKKMIAEKEKEVPKIIIKKIIRRKRKEKRKKKKQIKIIITKQIPTVLVTVETTTMIRQQIATV
jgi:hypothetical protein